MRFLDRFTHVLLDMNGTFMFWHDRFGPDEDYHRVYREVGGQSLDKRTVEREMRAALDAILRVYDDPAYFDDFPSLAEVFRAHTTIPEAEVPIFERLFAALEIGRVPAGHDAFLRALARTHELGVVSNICAHPDVWLPAFGTDSAFSVFRHLTFSSTGRSIKPSFAIFRRALAHVPPNATILFVGDNLRRDIVPAKALGLATAWIAPAGSQHPDADVVVESLPDLATLGA